MAAFARSRALSLPKRSSFSDSLMGSTGVLYQSGLLGIARFADRTELKSVILSDFFGSWDSFLGSLSFFTLLKSPTTTTVQTMA